MSVHIMNMHTRLLFSDLLHPSKAFPNLLHPDHFFPLLLCLQKTQSSLKGAGFSYIVKHSLEWLIIS